MVVKGLSALEIEAANRAASRMNRGFLGCLGESIPARKPIPGHRQIQGMGIMAVDRTIPAAVIPVEAIAVAGTVAADIAAGVGTRDRQSSSGSLGMGRTTSLSGSTLFRLSWTQATAGGSPWTRITLFGFRFLT
jgi:hypothetical protein